MEQDGWFKGKEVYLVSRKNIFHLVSLLPGFHSGDDGDDGGNDGGDGGVVVVVVAAGMMRYG